jgi:hypothetical protein
MFDTQEESEDREKPNCGSHPQRPLRIAADTIGGEEPKGRIMSPHRHRFPLPSFVLALLLAAGCLGQDFLDFPLDVDELDHGWRVSIEPGEQLDVGLMGNAVYPETPWQIAGFDSAVIELQHEEHETPRPPSGDPEATEGDSMTQAR